jgi:hypothetical protein
MRMRATGSRRGKQRYKYREEAERARDDLLHALLVTVEQAMLC